MSDRVWRHIRREPDEPLWRQGAAYLTLRSAGVRWRNAGRRDIELSAEWHVLPPKSHRHGVGVAFKWPAGIGSIRLSLYASALGSLWLRLDGLLPERFHAPGHADREAYVRAGTLSTGWTSWAVRAALWSKVHHWSSRAPWWEQEHKLGLGRLLGKWRTDSTVVDSGDCVVPLPERSYPASFEVERFEGSWTGPLGRRLPPKVWHRCKVTPETPIPIPGKGENSWDCDDDHVHSTSVVGRDPERAVGDLVASVLSTRARYGGAHMNEPSS